LNALAAVIDNPPKRESVRLFPGTDIKYRNVKMPTKRIRCCIFTLIESMIRFDGIEAASGGMIEPEKVTSRVERMDREW
jgi:hypothetical protein